MVAARTDLRFAGSILALLTNLYPVQGSRIIVPEHLWNGSIPNFHVYSELTCRTCFNYQNFNQSLMGLKEQEINSSTIYFLETASPQQKCCEDAKKCWEVLINDFNTSSTFPCSSLWDGIQCWEAQKSQTRVYGRCPGILYVNEERSPCHRYSSRYCRTESPPTVYKTDYTTCQPLEFHKNKNDHSADLQEAENLKLSNKRCCRTERKVGLSWSSFLLDTCARCYMYLPHGLLSSHRFIYNQNTGQLKDPISNITYWAEWSNTSHPIYKTFLSHSAVSKWRSCCVEAHDCCATQHFRYSHEPNVSFLNSHVQGNLYCPTTWDGWQCFPSTPAGKVALTPCADHVYFKTEKPSCPKFAEKTCMEDGRWFVDEQKGKERTSYRSCGRIDEIRRQLFFHIIMYAISVAALIPALAIFFVYKQLQVYRISMHKHFFSSLLLNGFLSIIFKCIVMLDELDGVTGNTILDYNHSWCKSLFIFTKYFRLTNYLWMFSEGFYLHKLISAAFAEQKSLVLYYFIGWGFPIVPITIYASLRKVYYDEQCWVIPSNSVEWFLNGPSLLSLVINLFFLCNIIRVLLTKLRATHSGEPSQYRKAVRATIVLIPLFGLHFLFILYRPQSGSCGFLTGYVYFSHTLDGLQGFFVALTFCYFNGEVMYLLRRTYQRRQLLSSLGRQSITVTNATHLSLTTQVSMTEFNGA